ncbi:DUF4331 family protein (plasmid) [Rhizobium sp. CC1099]|uniref:DUF4331 family protein n=1 Tax=Rhizobium sp. CC1099 TaxID=3039160 RepID=UPI0024B0C1C9|nr:DUF4331 family protein [Rhizobium sp. CC1099]WFU91368.1 DUF4331 family protein [Rhizobium sp. CC1099]
MSHHLDSPIARQDIRLDITDLYAFRGEMGTVLAINVCHSIFGEIPVPGYHPEGMYEFKIDTDGDAVENVTYRLTFDDRDEEAKQRWVLRRVTGNDAVNPDARGDFVAAGMTDQIVKTDTGLKVWAGRAGDPFWIEPDVLHAVGHAFQDGTKADLSTWDPAKAKNLFAGHSVYSIVLEIPDAELAAADNMNGKIGIWAVATLATDAGGWRSVNRVGLPMLPPLFTQFNEDLGNRLNAGCPSDDFAIYSDTVIKSVAGVVAAYGTSEDPKGYARRFAERLLPNMLPYKVGTQAVFGFSDWNGRSLTDNVPDVMFSLASNTPISLGIGKESVSSKPSKTFPYMPAIS